MPNWPLIDPLTSTPFATYPDFDFGWTPPGWSTAVGQGKSTSPLVAVVALKPATTEDSAERNALMNIVREAPIPTRLEDRPIARLALAGGDLLTGSAGPGTLGGFVRDRKSGKIYGVTCGHVAPQGNVVDGNGKSIGSTAYGVEPKINSPGALCDIRDAAAIINDHDIALIDLTVKETPTGLSGWTWRFGHGQALAMQGTGSAQYKVGLTGGYAVFYRFTNGPEYCFRNAFEIRPVSSVPVQPIAPLFTTVPQQGDSGTWVTVQGASGREWAGMLIGVDTQFGYAIEADTIINWAKGKPNLDLVVV